MLHIEPTTFPSYFFLQTLPKLYLSLRPVRCSVYSAFLILLFSRPPWQAMEMFIGLHEKCKPIAARFPNPSGYILWIVYGWKNPSVKLQQGKRSQMATRRKTASTQIAYQL